MHIKKFVGITALLLGALILPAHAEAPTPGSTDDPVVTKSYVDQKVAEEIAKIKGGVTSPNPTPTPGATTPPATGVTDGVTVIQLQAGQTLYGAAGAEFIVRTGKTLVVSNDDGVPDVTAGKDLAPNTAITTNHLLIFPREGRGVKPDPKSKDDIYIMVKGGYLLLNADGSRATP